MCYCVFFFAFFSIFLGVISSLGSTFFRTKLLFVGRNVRLEKIIIIRKVVYGFLLFRKDL